VTQQTIQPLDSSFRDPSGFVFEKDGTLYRQVNNVFKEDFDHFISSGCYDHLREKECLIFHEEIVKNFTGSPDWYKTLKPQRLRFISYPYEWCFDMLKDAALLTLQLAKECTQFGIILKDATPFNIQWLDGKPVFIDTLSFERYDESKPWIAYRQFCENFLSPLLLMHYLHQPLQSILLVHPEGIPLSMTRSLLPWRSKFSFYTYLHIHMHERLASRSTSKEIYPQNNRPVFSGKKLHRLLDSLQSLIKSLAWKGKATSWDHYYQEANQRDDYVLRKKKIIIEWLSELPGTLTAVDLGANEGAFSFLLAAKNVKIIAADSDHSTINKLYQKIKKEKERNILPLLIELANPSSASGLNNKERISFIERTNCDLGLALALVHHLAIGKNIPFERIAELFEKLAHRFIIEFVPKTDEKVQLMLQQKRDIYNDYDEPNFERAFEKYFLILNKQLIGSSGRFLYLVKRK
jgi:ribosomal protein L11 methylase PrmA